jgi:hypothetical protein
MKTINQDVFLPLQTCLKGMSHMHCIQEFTIKKYTRATCDALKFTQVNWLVPPKY